MFSFIPIIVGSIFFAIGFNYIAHFLKLRRIAKQVKGRIIAIEKYISTTRGDNNTPTKTTYYRPVVEYQYNNETHRTSGVSVNEIRHKLNQHVPVLLNISEDGKQIQASLDDSLNIFMGVIFALAGIGALCIYPLIENGSWIAPLIAVCTTTGAGHIISSMILNFSSLIKNADGEHTPKEDSVLIETKSEYIKEVSAHGFWGGLIAAIFLLGSLGIMYAAYNDIPTTTQNLIWNDFTTFWNHLTNGTFRSSTEKPLMLFGIGLFFFLASLRSVYYVRKKYGALLRM
ncbi:MAG: hypothetical protein ACRBCK_01045 [Alphaproteobacteria bacterium]